MTHTNNINKIIKCAISGPEIPVKSIWGLHLLERFIYSEIEENNYIEYKINPIYFSTNYIKKFQNIYPQYKLSKGE